jgi:hypothetical protein
MRQQFLAREMEKAKELGADVVSLLHISPAYNLVFKRVTSPDMCRSLPDDALPPMTKLALKPID